MDVLIMVSQLITGLSILVFIHELGHFMAAKAFGIKVDKFYIFFDAWGYKLFSFKKGETEYGIGWIPLGGYVKIAGMIDESMDKEQMKKEPESWEFRSKPKWQRFIVMIGGIVMNLILGVVIYSLSLFVFAEKYLPVENMTKGVYAYELAREIGLETGDKIIAINGDPITRFKDITSAKMLLGDEITVLRGKKEVTLDMPKGFLQKFAGKGRGAFIGLDNHSFKVGEIQENSPADTAGLKEGDFVKKVGSKSIPNFGSFKEALQANAGKETTLIIERNRQVSSITVNVRKNGTIGFMPELDHDYAYVDYSIFSSFTFGFKDAFNDLMYQSIVPLGKIFTNEINASDSFQGPIGIARIYGATWQWDKFWYITGLISMVLAFMNFLPIPALDGGHILFILIEAVARRPLPESFLEKAQVVGMILLLGLMALVIGNDILKIFQ